MINEFVDMYVYTLYNDILIPFSVMEYIFLSNCGVKDRSGWHFTPITLIQRTFLLYPIDDHLVRVTKRRASPPLIDFPFVFRLLTQNEEQCGHTQQDSYPGGIFHQALMKYSLP